MGITARQCVAIIADNQANRRRADESDRKLAIVKHENDGLKARIARLEARHRKLYRKSVCLKQECRKESEACLRHFQRADDLAYEIFRRDERIRVLALTFKPWRWQVWRHVANYVNACLGRVHVDVT